MNILLEICIKHESILIILKVLKDMIWYNLYYLITLHYNNFLNNIKERSK